MKKFLLTMLALVCAVGVWAETITTDWVDYSKSFHSQLTAERTSLSVIVDDNPTVTLARTSGSTNIAWATVDKIKRPWMRGGNKFAISVAKGKIVGYEIVTRGMAANNVTFEPFQFKYGMEGNLLTSDTQQQNQDKTITVDGYDANSIVLDLTAWNPTGNQGLVIIGLRLKFQYDRPKVTINVQNEGDSKPQCFTEAYIEPGIVTLSDYLPSFSFVTYTGTTATVTEDSEQTFTVGYTVDAANDDFPFVTSFDDLESSDKWVSMYTLNGRMHVRDTKDGANVAKYPTIDKATFTRLNDNYFWAFVRTGGVFSPTYIVNKAAGKDQTLYLTSDGNDMPVLLSTEANKGNNWVTNEWVLEKSTRAAAVSTGDKYFGIRANGTTRYINNFENKGFMTTFSTGQNADDGSNHKFIPELETYNILKERALKAPANAAHSLNAAARAAINANTNNSVEGYKTLIADINNGNTETGYIDFDQSRYYMLRNYTPETAGAKIYVLGSSNGTGSCTFEVPAAEAGDADNVMTYSNVNAIWKITANGNAAGGDGQGASRTVPRHLTHINSAKKFSAINNTTFGSGASAVSVAARSLVDNDAYAANYYFVDLGAGQHFLKNTQYSGTGNQAKAKPLHCNDDGTLREGDAAHKKNTRATWYGIEVTKVKVTIGATGYATLHLPFGVNLPTGTDLKAYAVSAVSATQATMTEMTAIPANEGVILTGTANTTYELTINDAVAAWAEGDNLLKGSNMHETISEEGYVLSQPAGKQVGLYKAQGGNSWLNNDNKAYLPASVFPAEAPSLSFVFDTETSIKGIDAAKADNAIYDLSGRRVKSATKGIFIINGKKVIK